MELVSRDISRCGILNRFGPSSRIPPTMIPISWSSTPWDTMQIPWNHHITTKHPFFCVNQCVSLLHITKWPCRRDLLKLNYLLYTPTVPPELTRNDAESHFVPSSTELRQILQEKSETIRGIAPVGMTGVPEVLQGYHTLVPLEPTGPGVERRKMGNWYSTVYRAIKGSDGMPYTLRRIEGEFFCFLVNAVTEN